VSLLLGVSHLDALILDVYGARHCYGISDHIEDNQKIERKVAGVTLAKKM
jgi:hypothetical protein